MASDSTQSGHTDPDPCTDFRMIVANERRASSCYPLTYDVDTRNLPACRSKVNPNAVPRVYRNAEIMSLDARPVTVQLSIPKGVVVRIHSEKVVASLVLLPNDI